ncbi:hypothetical protein TNIN_440261 [Trichonephila inaurata madagascariensis]|uniref:Sleeping Beauty transposase HTH domain-containing protein n=1 Tax=Trichonephila inaurata madagascariensis TaxID=2747483 RepID=A0A8X6XFV6_9ARAC|nr:hypothetical protein TNIN_440261 [Trichonephila inaurata madagascariensis]
MAPKKSELPISLREKIVSLRENGLSYREIGKNVNVCFSTVRYIIKRHKEREYTSNKLRSGRPKKHSLRIKRKIIREASKNPFVSAITLAKMMSLQHLELKSVPKVFEMSCMINKFMGDLQGKDLSLY